MSRSFIRLSVLVSCLALVALMTGPAHARKRPVMMLGPGDANVSNIGDKALIRWSKFGFIYIAGQQDSHITITHDKAKNTLTYRDTGTRILQSFPKKRCNQLKAKRGIAVTCKIPKAFDDKKMFVQVWPRLGNDVVDARTLPKRFRLWALMDAGNDVVHGGAGNDFVNGAKGNDRVWGNGGNDLLRGGPGNDILRGGPGKDRLSCAEGFDTAYRDKRDSLYQCERVLQDRRAV